MSDLVEKIRMAIDGDERAALAWLPFGNPDAVAREHFARHDPARVLRQVEAHRKLLELAKVMYDDYYDNGADRLIEVLADIYEIEVE